MTKIPDGWIECKLGDFVTLKNGYAFKSEDYISEGVAVVRISDIQDGVVRTDKAVRIDERNSKEGFKIEKGDVLVAMSGATTGKIGRFVSDEPALQNQRVGNLQPRDPKMSRSFIYYWISVHKKDIEEKAYGGAQPNISSKLIEEIDTVLPSLPEQNRIVAKLDTLFAHLDQLRARLEKIPTLLKQFRQAVLTQAVTGKLTEEWSQISVGSLGKWSGGGTPSKSISKYWNNGTVPWITPKDMKDFYLNDSQDKISNEATEVATLKLIETNSILIVVRSGILRRILPLAMNIVPTTINQDLKAITLHKDYYPKFIFYSLLALEGEIRNRCMKSGTTVESIELPLLKNFNLRIPKTIEEQKEIVRRVESLFAIADKIEASYKILQEKIDQLPQAILSKAFRGELVKVEVEEFSMAAEAKESYGKARAGMKI